MWIIKSLLIMLIMLVSTLGQESQSPEIIDEENSDYDIIETVTHKTYMDLGLESKSGKVYPIGRIVFGLFGNVVPKTVLNFKIISTGEAGKTIMWRGTDLHYKNYYIHRIHPGLMI